MRPAVTRAPLRARSAVLVAALLVACAARALAAEAETRTPAQIARDARTHEDAGRYGAALVHQKTLRSRIAPDADLELVVALNEARVGLADSAWARLHGPVLSAALADTGDASRHHDYPYAREGFWVNGRFDGWYWYVARARAELALARGDWLEARRAAVQAVEARPFSGKDALLLAVASAHTGDLAFSEAAAAYAKYLEPGLPEAHYLLGLHLWRNQRRLEAGRAFQDAMEADSAFAPAALALVRLRLPGTRPDSLPRGFLTGLRRAAELNSPVSPKVEEEWQQDTAPMLAWNPQTPLADSLKTELKLTRPLTIYIQVLIDGGGRARALELPYAPRDRLPIALMHHLSRDILNWRFVAPTRFNQSVVAWVTAEYVIAP